MFTLENVSPLLAQNLADEFKRNATSFESLKSSAIEEIKQYVTLDEAEPLPESLLTIAAWIMNFVGMGKYTTVPDHDRIRYLKMYDIAIERLRQLAPKKAGFSAFKLEVMEW